MMPTTPTHLSTAEKGQALPLGLAFIAAATLLMLVVFNTGQIASEKTQVANAADAAVYSGLVWQARSLNFQAYTNRAMVANQVSIAQMVSLGSWTNYGRISARNLDTAIGWVPVIAPFTEALLQGMEVIESVVQVVAEVAIPIIDGTNSVLSVAQEAVYNASYIATPEVVSAVVKANDSRYSAASTYSIAAGLHNAEAWNSLSVKQSDESGLARKANVINRSLDEFSGNRGWNKLPGLPRRVQVTPVDRFMIIKEGTTRLAQSGTEWEWRGKDGLSIHWEHYKCSIRKGCRWKRQEIPMGWGSNYAEGDGACSGGACSSLFASNRWAEYLSDAEAEDLSGYSGVKTYRSLKDLSSANRDPRLVLRVEVDVDDSDIRTAEQITQVGSANATAGGLRKGLESGLFHTDDTYASDAIASISAGEVFFERPVITAGELRVAGSSEPVTEYANLFNPYWDVRLIELSTQERQAAWLLRSPELIEGAVVAAIQNGVNIAADSLTDSATNAASERLSEYTGVDRNDISEYTALGQAAISTLQGDFIEDAIKDAAVGALKEAATSAASSYAESSGYGAAFNTASDVLEDGEINSDDLRNAAGRAVENTAVGGALENATDLADGLLENAEGLADSLIATAGVTDAMDQITAGLEGESAALGDQLQESMADTFETELNLTEQLIGLQNSVDTTLDDLDAEADSMANTLRDEATAALNTELDGLQGELQGSLGDIQLDRDGIINSFTGDIDNIASDLVNEASDGLNTNIDDLKTSLTDRFGALEITPETVANGALESAGAFVGETADNLQNSVAQSLGQLSDRGETLLNDQVQTTVEQARELVQEQVGSAIEQGQNGLNTELPSYVE